MKSEDLVIGEVIDFSEGWLSLKGRRLVIQDIRAFSQLRKDLTDSIGIDQARRLLTRFGYFWGHADAAAMKRIFTWDNTREWLLACSKLQTIQGITKAMITSLDFDEGTGRFAMEIVWNNSMEAEGHLNDFGPSDHPICWLLTAYTSGYASFCMAGETSPISSRKIVPLLASSKSPWRSFSAPVNAPRV